LTREMRSDAQASGHHTSYHCRSPSRLDVVAKFRLLGPLAPHTKLQQQSHDAEGDHSTTTSNKHQGHQAHSALLAGLLHLALLAIETRLAETLSIVTDTTEEAIVVT